MRSKLNLVDLAGSERWSAHHHEVTGAVRPRMCLEPQALMFPLRLRLERNSLKLSHCAPPPR
jgi:hypothetical protein